jgi:hypothetical protein
VAIIFGVVHQQPHRTNVAIGAVGEVPHSARVAHVAHDVYRQTSCRTELVAKYRDGGGVDVGQNNCHPQCHGMVGQAGAYSCACAGDDGDATGKRFVSSRRIHAYCRAGRGAGP